MAMRDFVTNARDPLYGGGRYQQDPNFDWTQTDVIGGVGGYLEQNPEAVWTRYLAGRMGITPTTSNAFGRWMQNQRGAAENAFLAAQAEDPTLTYQRYINSMQAQQWLDAYNRLSSAQRGENVSRFAGPSRWLSDL